MATIGVVTTSYPRFPGDAAGSFVAAHVAAMRALGHDVEVVAAGDHPLFYGGGAPDELERRGGWLGAVRFTAKLTAAVARRRWDLCIAHWLVPSAIAALPSTMPLLAIAHGGDVHTLRRTRLLAPVMLALRARRARLAFVSDELRRLAGAPGIVQPMGVDVAHFAGLGRAPNGSILVVARLVPIKGVDVAVRALGERLVVAGDGPERARLERLGPARFVGAVDAAARDRLLREASVVVVPSRILPNGRTEGMPMIALEALAAGVPVVASAVGGLRELAMARRVAPDDPEALAAAVAATLATPPSPDALRASISHLAWPMVARRLLAHADSRRSA